MKLTPKQIAIIVAGVLFLIILLQNTQMVTLHLLFWPISMSQIILLMMMLIFGFILGYFMHSLRLKKKSSSMQ